MIGASKSAVFTLLNLSYLSHNKVCFFSFRHDLGHYSRTQYFQNQFKGLIKPSSGRVSPPTVHHGMFDHGSQEIWRSETFLQVWMWHLRNRIIKIYGGIWFERISRGGGVVEAIIIILLLTNHLMHLVMREEWVRT